MPTETLSAPPVTFATTPSPTEPSNEPPSAIETQIAAIVAHQAHEKRNRVHFQMERGQVLLRGEVASFLEKQSVQERIRKLDGDLSIKNDLQVIR